VPTSVLPMISVSVKAAVVRDGHVLLLSYDDDSGFHYNLPGGKAQHVPDQSLATAGRRTSQWRVSSCEVTLLQTPAP
jgi:hypothetical protein